MTRPRVSWGPLTEVVSAWFLRRRASLLRFVIKEYFVRRRYETGSLSPKCPIIHLFIAGWTHVSYCIKPFGLIHAYANAQIAPELASGYPSSGAQGTWAHGHRCLSGSFTAGTTSCCSFISYFPHLESACR